MVCFFADLPVYLHEKQNIRISKYDCEIRFEQANAVRGNAILKGNEMCDFFKIF